MFFNKRTFLAPKRREIIAPETHFRDCFLRENNFYSRLCIYKNNWNWDYGITRPCSHQQLMICVNFCTTNEDTEMLSFDMNIRFTFFHFWTSEIYSLKVLICQNRFVLLFLLFVLKSTGRKFTAPCSSLIQIERNSLRGISELSLRQTTTGFGCEQSVTRPLSTSHTNDICEQIGHIAYSSCSGQAEWNIECTFI